MTDHLASHRHRLLLCYKGDISALILFAQQANGSICFPNALPTLSSTLDNATAPDTNISLHPSVLLKRINEDLQLDNDLLRIEAGFNVQVDAPGGLITVHLARFTLLDPPHQLMQARHCKFSTLPELCSRPPAEMALLRRAYSLMMEG